MLGSPVVFQDWFKGSDIQHKSFFDQSRKRSLQQESSQPEQRQQWLGLRCWCHPLNIHGLQIKRKSVNRWNSDCLITHLERQRWRSRTAVQITLVLKNKMQHSHLSHSLNTRIKRICRKSVRSSERSEEVEPGRDLIRNVIVSGDDLV